MKRTFTVLMLAALASPALAAEPTEAEKRTVAETIFEQASTAMATHDYATACPKLEEVVRLQPNGIGARLKLAECYEASGRLASAHASYGQAASMASIAGQNDRARVAESKAGALEARLSRLTIKVSAEIAALPGLSVMRGGLQVTPSVFNEPIAIDGGRYTVVAAADGREPFTATFDIDASGDTQEIELRLRRSEPRLAAPSRPNREPAAVERGAIPMGPIRTGGIVVGVVGLGLAGSGIGMVGAAAAQGEDAVAAKDASSNDEQLRAARADYDAADHLLAGGWALTAVGAAAAVAGVVMVAIPPPSDVDAGAAGLRVRIGVGPAGLIALGAW